MKIYEPEFKDGKWWVHMFLLPETPVDIERDFDTEEEAIKFYELNLWINRA